jgi:hypothetical protein
MKIRLRQATKVVCYTNLQSLDKDYQKTKFTVGTNQQ